MARYAFSKITDEVVDAYRTFLGTVGPEYDDTANVVPLNMSHDEDMISMMILVENTTDFKYAENRVRTTLDLKNIPHDLVVAEENGSTEYDVFVAVYYGTR